MDDIDMQMVQTIDGREVPVAQLKAIFDYVCHWNTSHDPSFYWKEPLSFEAKYLNTDQVNDVQTAISFYVGGNNTISISNDPDLGMVFSLYNHGYYTNIGA